MTGDDLPELLLRAYIDRLGVRWSPEGWLVLDGPAHRPVIASSRMVPLDDTGGPAVAPPGGAGGDGCA